MRVCDEWKKWCFHIVSPSIAPCLFALQYIHYTLFVYFGKVNFGCERGRKHLRFSIWAHTSNYSIRIFYMLLDGCYFFSFTSSSCFFSSHLLLLLLLLRVCCLFSRITHYFHCNIFHLDWHHTHTHAQTHMKPHHKVKFNELKTI